MSCRSQLSFFARVAFLFAPAALFAANHDLGKYPFRVQIIQYAGKDQYQNGELIYSFGSGLANLYENGNPRGFHFEYRCSDKMTISEGFETYPAKWKKTDQTLEILTPVPGKADATHSCDLKVIVKDFVYIIRRGGYSAVTAEAYKQWMASHQYDPEHGKNTPVNLGTIPQ